MKYGLLFLFVGVLLAGGLWGMRRSRTMEDFYLGGRSVGPWMSAFAYGTTYFSAVIFVGYAGKVGWGFGLSALWVVLGNTLIGSLLTWLVLAKRTRQMTVQLNALTLPEFFAARFQDKRLKFFAALIIFVFLVPYSASVYMGLSYLFTQVFGVSYFTACLGMCILTGVYLIMGGYRAVALTDFVQGLVMLVGAGVLFHYVLAAPQVGGFFAAIDKLAAINPQLVEPVGPPGWLPLVSLVFLTSFGVMGMPQMLQKFYAVRDEAAIKPAMIISTLFALIVTTAAYFTGSLTRLFFTALPVDPMTAKPTPDLMIPQIIQSAFPDFAQMLILLLVLAASMSTLASLVLVSSSAVVVDIFKDVLPKWTAKHGVTLSRLLCLIFVVLSLVIALMKPSIILSLMAMSWGSISGAFLAPYIYGLFWRRASNAGIWAGMISGLLISVGGSWWFKLNAEFIPLVSCIAMLVPFVIVPVVSWCTSPMAEKHIDYAFVSTVNEAD